MSALRPGEVLDGLLALDADLGLRDYYSEEAVFYNPGGTAPLGVIFAAVKDHDGPNDRASELSRPGVYRLAFQLDRADFAHRFGAHPPRPPKGGVIEGGFDFRRLDRLSPHPVYGFMSWVQVLSPSAATLASLEPALAASLDGVRARWQRRVAA